MWRAALCLLLVGCTAAEEALDPGADAGAVGVGADADVRTDGGVPTDAGVGPDAATACEGLAALPAANRRDVLRLGFGLADTVLEVRAEAPAGGPRPVALAVVTRVHRGHRFLEGQTVTVELDGPTTRRGPFPRDLLLGLTEPGLPVRSDGPAPELSRVLIAAEVEERAIVEDLIGFRVGAEPFVAGVEFTGRSDSRIEARVIEPIAGNVPERIVFNWGGPYEAAWPAATGGAYIVSFAYEPSRLPDGSFLGSSIDARPFTAEARADVQAALSNPWVGLDGAALGGLAQTYDMSWRFHRAPRVVATEVTGLAGECCTGAGGTYVEHVVQDDLRGDAVEPRLVRGGHGYYSDEACGQRRLLGLEPLVASVEGTEFVCDLMSAGLPSGLPVPQVHVEREDSPEARAEVQSWLSAPSPHYLLHVDAPEFAGQPSSGPWSTTRTAVEALALGQLVRIRVQAVRERADGATEVVLHTPFATDFYDHLEVHEVRLAFTCGDPRLSTVGSEWLVPLFGDSDFSTPGGRASEGGLFLVPGALFEADGPAVGLAQRVSRALRPPG